MLLTAVMALVAAAPFEQPIHIDDVRVEGLWITDEGLVRRELAFAVPGPASPALWDLSENRLWNLRVFSRVQLILEVNAEGRTTCLVRVEDRFPLGPIVRFSVGGNQFFFWAGITYGNLFGRAVEARAWYEHFGGYHGFATQLTDPRFAKQRLSMSLQTEWLMRPRPDFVGRRAAVRLVAEWTPPWWPDDTIRPTLAVEGSSDDFPFSATDRVQRQASLALTVTPGLKLGRMDLIRLLQRGWTVDSRFSFGTTTESQAKLPLRVDVEAQAFWTLGERVNLGARVLVGTLQGVRQQDLYFIGGLDLVRGYKDSEVKATSWLVSNLELRVVAFDSTWFAVMPIALVDGAVATTEGGGQAAMLSAGLGVRLMVPRLNRVGVRFDVSVPFISSGLTSAFRPAFNFGAWHFF